jgi:hypothetical protein
MPGYCRASIERMRPIVPQPTTANPISFFARAMEFSEIR